MNANYAYRVAILICSVLFMCLFPAPAIPDDDDGPPILVTNTDDSGPGSLRQAILDANLNPGKDEIDFAIPGIGPHTIRPDSALPTITDRVEIDGYSQLGAERNDNDEWEPNSAVLKIVLDGSLITDIASGLHITAGDSKIRGLVIHSFTTGVLIETEGDNKIEENFIGLDVTGTTAPGNTENGIEIKGIGTSENKVDENVISGNVLNGVLIWMGSEENEVIRNFIGTGVTGTETLGNGDSGIRIEGASDNKVGGKSHDDGNLIANNGAHGVAIVGPAASKNRVLSNYIGVDLSGTIAAPNKGDGVAVENASSNLIGGREEDDGDDDEEEKERKGGNLISGNSANGVRIEGVEARKNVIRSNLIGTDATGEFALGNDLNGVAFLAGASHNLVGGSWKHARNIISGNGLNGVFLTDLGTGQNRVEGNYIGTDILGKDAIPNGLDGVAITTGASDNTVGGARSGAGNLISGNTNRGVSIGMTDTQENKVQGNHIGTTALPPFRPEDDNDDDRDSRHTKTAAKKRLPLGNGSDGVAVFMGATDNLVGGSRRDDSNVIAYNGNVGVLIYNSSATVRNRVSQNSIFDNDDIGIDLSLATVSPFRDGVTPNDAGDTDDGPNNLQNFPVIDSAIFGGGILTVKGTIDTQDPDKVTIEFFASSEADPSGNGEGEEFLGATKPNSLGEFEVALGEPKAGEFISATATDNDGNTSEFSATVEMERVPCDLAVDPTSHDFGEVNTLSFVDKIFVLSNSAKSGENCGGSISMDGDREFSIICLNDERGDDDHKRDDDDHKRHKDHNSHRHDKDDDDCTIFDIAPGKTHKFVVRFDCRKQEPDDVSATITIASNDPAGDIIVEVEGTCVAPPDIAASRTELNFGATTVDSVAKLTSTIKNVGQMDLVITRVFISGENEDQFSLLDFSVPDTLESGEEEEITVCFAPDSAGDKIAQVNIESNDPDENPFIIELRGEAVDPQPDITVDPVDVDFGRVFVGSDSLRAVCVINDGTADLVVDSTTVTGSDSADWQLVEDGAPFTLAPGDTQKIAIRFEPDSVGALSATLEIRSNDPDENPFLVNLQGNARDINPDIAVDSVDVDFGQVVIGQDSRGVICVTNEGMADLVVDSTFVTGPDSADWQITFGGAPFTLATDDTQKITISFKSTTLGLKGATLVFTSNDPDENPFLVTLRAEAVEAEPDIAVDPAALDFGEVTIGNTFDLDLCVTNEGTADLVVDSTTVTGSDSSDWQVTSSAAAFTLTPGDSQKITIRFTPTSAGAKSASLVIHSNDPDENPLAIAQTGVGVSKQLVDPVQLTLTFGENGTSDFTGVTRDAYMDGGNPRNNMGATRMIRVGNEAEPAKGPYRSLIRFDFLQSLTELGVTHSGQIVDASLEFYVYASKGADDDGLDISVFALNREWHAGQSEQSPAVEGEVTWLDARTGLESWSVAGAAGVDEDRGGDAADTRPVNRAGVRVKWNVTGSLQSMLDAGENNGWSLQARDEGKDKHYRLCSSEHAKTSRRPQLTIVVEVSGSAQTSLAKQQSSASGSQLNIEASTALPDHFALQQNYPNPFNPDTQIRYALPTAATVTLSIFNVAGSEVRRLLDRAATPAGGFSAVWDGRDASGRASSSGVYFYRIFVQPQDGETAPFVQTRRMILLK